jgi:hypothetical protein
VCCRVLSCTGCGAFGRCGRNVVSELLYAAGTCALVLPAPVWWCARWRVVSVGIYVMPSCRSVRRVRAVPCCLGLQCYEAGSVLRMDLLCLNIRGYVRC